MNYNHFHSIVFWSCYTMFPLYRIAFWSVPWRTIIFCRSVVGSIRHDSCFHLERYDEMINIVYYVIHINFLIKSTDSCWKLRRGQHETSRKIYIKLQSIVKHSGLKKNKTKNILADSRKLKCREKFYRISVDWRWYPATNGSHAKLEKLKKIAKGLTGN